MRILGIDPGLAILGWGIVDTGASKVNYVAHGTINTVAGTRFQDRLVAITNGMAEIIEVYKPNEIAFEELFFAKNVKTALSVGAARGCAISEAAKYTNMLFEYTPMQIKQAIIGYGRAEKHQIQQMVKLMLTLQEIPKPDDAADALALAITHANVGFAKEEFRMK